MKKMNRRAHLDGHARLLERARHDVTAPISATEDLCGITLSLVLCEELPHGGEIVVSQVREVLVAEASAALRLLCGDDCAGGGYDFTAEVLQRLSAGDTSFEGRGSCQGTRRGAPCGRRTRFRAEASYREAPAPHDSDGQRTRERRLYSRTFR